MDSFVGGFVGALIAGRRRGPAPTSDFGELLTKTTVRYMSGDPARAKPDGIVGATLEIRTRGIVERRGQSVRHVVPAEAVLHASIISEPRRGRPMQLLSITTGIVTGPPALAFPTQTLRYYVTGARPKAAAEACVKAIGTMRQVMARA